MLTDDLSVTGPGVTVLRGASGRGDAVGRGALGAATAATATAAAAGGVAGRGAGFVGAAGIASASFASELSAVATAISLRFGVEVSEADLSGADAIADRTQRSEQFAPLMARMREVLDLDPAAQW